MALNSAGLSILTAAFVEVFGEKSELLMLLLTVPSVVFVVGVDLNTGLAKTPVDGKFSRELNPGVSGVPFTVGCIILT